MNCTKQEGEDGDAGGKETSTEIVKRAVSYVHISRVSDERTTSLSRYKGKTVSCRIVGFSEFDGRCGHVYQNVCLHLVPVP